jgi:hypothetical protein
MQTPDGDGSQWQRVAVATPDDGPRRRMSGGNDSWWRTNGPAATNRVALSCWCRQRQTGAPAMTNMGAGNDTGPESSTRSREPMIEEAS